LCPGWCRHSIQKSDLKDFKDSKDSKDLKDIKDSEDSKEYKKFKEIRASKISGAKKSWILAGSCGESGKWVCVFF
jgi:hypothetical protein